MIRILITQRKKNKEDNYMGKNLKGKSIGRGICQQKIDSRIILDIVDHRNLSKNVQKCRKYKENEQY